MGHNARSISGQRSPEELKNEQQDAGHSQSSRSIRDARSAEPRNSVTVHYAGGLNRPRSLSVASETAGAPGASDPPEPFVCRDALLAAGHRGCAQRALPQPFWNCWQAMTLSNHVPGTAPVKSALSGQPLKRVGTAAMAMPADPERCW